MLATLPMLAPPRPGNSGDPARAPLPGRVSASESQLASSTATLFLHYFFHFSIFLFSLVSIALGAIPGSPQLRILTALYDLLIPREFHYSVCNFVDALVAIYQLRVLVRYVCIRYVCTPSLPPLPPQVGLVGCSRLWGVPGNRLPSKLGGLAPPPVCSADILFYRNKVISHQHLTFRLSGHQQQQQKPRLEFFFCHRV